MHVICSGHFEGEPKVFRRLTEQLAPEFFGGELVEREVAADGGENLGVFAQALRLEELLREAPARQVAIAAVDLPEPAFVLPGTAADVDMLCGAAARRRSARSFARGSASTGLRIAGLPRLRSAVVVGIGAGFDQPVGRQIGSSPAPRRWPSASGCRPGACAAAARRSRPGQCARRAAGRPDSWRDCRSSTPGARVWKRGASTAACAFMPKSITSNSTCISDCS